MNADRSVAARSHVRVRGNTIDVAQTVTDLLGDVASDAPLDRIALVGHIARPYAPIPPRSIYEGVSSGQIGTVASSAGNRVTFSTTWDPVAVKPNRRLSLEDAAEAVRRSIFEAVEQSGGSGPFAATLSSGMDSSSILAAAVATGRTPVGITWSAPGFPDADETAWARLTARHLDMPLIEMTLEAGDILPPEGVRTHWWTPELNIFEQVWNQTAATIVGEGLGSLWTGLGGDHLFGGSASPAGDMAATGRWIRLARHLRQRRSWYRSRPHMLRRELVAPLGKQVLRRRWAGRQQPEPWLHPSRHQQWRTLQQEVIGPGLLPGRAARLGGLLDGIVPQIAEYFDTTLAQLGVTAVNPLLHRTVVETALTIPAWWLNSGTTNKLVLRTAMKGLLPDEIVTLPKIYPTSIARAALRARPAQLQRLTKDMRLAEMRFVDERILSDFVAAFMRGEHDSMDFWNTLTLEDWLRRWR